MSAQVRRGSIGFATNDNEFGSLKFTGGDIADTRNHAVNVLPPEWSGRWVTITVIAAAGRVDIAFSFSASAEVAADVAATNAGVSAKVGKPYPDGSVEDVQLPSYTRERPLYFAREATVVGAIVVLTLSEDPQRTGTP